METESLNRVQASRLARTARREAGVLANALWRANRETGSALTPSTGQAQRPYSDEHFTRKLSQFHGNNFLQFLGKYSRSLLKPGVALATALT